MTVVRKPKIGVYIEGDNKAFAEVSRFLDNQVSPIPSTKEERVIYIFSKLLKADDYITIHQLADELYISRSTIEKIWLKLRKCWKKKVLLCIRNLVRA